jgi:HAD superfamily hydrolase (TIGR01458 family)
MTRRPPDILRKSHAHAERKRRAEGKAALMRDVEAEFGAIEAHRALLIDLDGVLYEGERAVPGAREAIAALAAHEVPRLYVTNTTSRPRSAIVARLAELRIDVRESEILTPPVVAAAWLREHVAGPAALFVPPATREDFAGCEVAERGKPAAAVVVGDYGEHWTAAELNRAFRLLMAEPRARLVALGMTRYWRAADGLRLDTGAFVTALAHAAGLEPIVLGKPAREFFAAALARLEGRPERTWMVGDDIRADVQGAQAAGLRAILVKTGKFRAADLELGIRPDVELGSLAELPDWWVTNARQSA